MSDNILVPAPKRGRGRPKGAPNKASPQREKRIAASGITPVDLMIEAMRWHHGEVHKALRSRGPDRLAKIAAHYADAVSVAADVAPYVHPKLQSVLHGNDPRNPLNKPGESTINHAHTHTLDPASLAGLMKLVE